MQSPFLQRALLFFIMAGFYIHIPFCAQQCTYCDFHFSTTFDTYRSQMIAAICTEIQLRKTENEQQSITTIYFGGGTPSILTSQELEQLIGTIAQHYHLLDAVEITLECNPDDCSLEHLTAWKRIGISRLSIGIQSFQSEQLAWMNRTHSGEEAKTAVQLARQVGFNEVSVDLIYGLPDLSTEDWRKQLQQVIALDVDHISAYCLTVEQKTTLAAWVKSGKIRPLSDDLQSEQFELLVAELAANGFEQYEISNFASKQRYSKHNTAYWQGIPYVGVGPSAHGFDGNTRYWNKANNAQYMQSLAKNELLETRETLSLTDQFNELIMLGLRTKWGVNKSQLVELQPLTDQWLRQKNQYLAQDMLIETETHLLLTHAGRLLADAIAADLFV
jgi:oxygen-independent coproporphyrinogen-3 oxidase